VLPIDQDETNDPAADAFVWVAPRPSMRFDAVTTSWECSSCGQRVTDRGPYNGYPEDDESGHGADCARHAEDVRAYRSRSGWDDEE